MRRCGDFKVFISPSRLGEITKNLVMECNDIGNNDYQNGCGKKIID
jgi:hypothetical protein